MSIFKPKDYQSVISVISVTNALEAIKWYKEALGAEEVDVTMDLSGKKVMHGAIKIDDTVIFIHDPFEGYASTAATSSYFIYVRDVDSYFKNAISHGGISKMEVADQFWGDRMGMFQDPFGTKWSISTRVKNLTKEERSAASEAFMKSYMAKKQQEQNNSTQNTTN